MLCGFAAQLFGVLLLLVILLYIVVLIHYFRFCLNPFDHRFTDWCIFKTITRYCWKLYSNKCYVSTFCTTASNSLPLSNCSSPNGSLLIVGGTSHTLVLSYRQKWATKNERLHPPTWWPLVLSSDLQCREFHLHTYRLLLQSLCLFSAVYQVAELWVAFIPWHKSKGLFLKVASHILLSSRKGCGRITQKAYGDAGH